MSAALNEVEHGPIKAICAHGTKQGKLLSLLGANLLPVHRL